VLSHDVVSHQSTPRYRQPMSLDTEALLESVSAANLYTMPDLELLPTFNNRASNIDG
jgi:hypothetical protein